ncbi:MAG TPA: ABC-2 family transporter protein [Chloroflexota bacterium]|nr:ABC-2 family transporter protein [Chloroflexota bacterium]
MIRAYRALLLAGFQNAVQYRVQMLLWLVGNLMRPVIFLAAWDAVARAQGGAVGSYSEGDFAAYYVCLTLVGQLTNAWDAWEFETQVRTGTLSPRLLRPFHPLHYAVVDNLIWKIFTLPALLPFLAVIAWSFHAHFTTQPWQIALFIPSVILGAALRFLFGWAVASLAFWTTRVLAISTLTDQLSFIFAGQVAPLALLPGVLQALAYLLPFGYMLGVPAEILQGGLGPDDALRLVLGQVVWLAVSFVAFRVAWGLGLRHYGAVGA